MRRGRINAGAPGRLVHIVDETSQRRFLVDTGAAYSIFPYSSPGKQSSPRLTGADGLHIPCWGERRLSLTFHGRLFVWPFLLAKVQFPIIGVDFLRHFKLLVDPAANRLVDTVSTQLLPTVSSVRSQKNYVFRDLTPPPPPLKMQRCAKSIFGNSLGQF